MVSMTATGHALIGVALAAQFSNPYIGIPIALASHILADYVPHWDAGTHGESKTKKQLRFEATADVLVGFVASYLLIMWLFPTLDLVYAFIMIIAAQGLDWGTAPYYFFGIKTIPFTWFHAISYSTNIRLDKPWGIVTQVIVVGLLVLGVYFY